MRPGREYLAKFPIELGGEMCDRVLAALHAAWPVRQMERAEEAKRRVPVLMRLTEQGHGGASFAVSDLGMDGFLLGDAFEQALDDAAAMVQAHPSPPSERCTCLIGSLRFDTATRWPPYPPEAALHPTEVSSADLNPAEVEETPVAPDESTPARSPVPGLTLEHWRDVVEPMAISVEIATRMGVRSAQQRGPGTLWPYRARDGRVVNVYRPTAKERAKDPGLSKYLWAKGEGLFLSEIVPPDDRHELNDIAIIEGTRQALAFASHAPENVAVYGMSGCAGSWGGVAGLKAIDVAGRTVYIEQDRDRNVNPQVYDGAAALAADLKAAGAGEVLFLDVPEDEDGSPTDGIDDVLGRTPPAQRTSVLIDMMQDAADELPERPEDDDLLSGLPDDDDEPVVDRFDQLVEKATIRERALRLARRRVDAEERPSLPSVVGAVLDDLDNIEDPRMLIEDLIPQDAIGFLGGKSGSYKTFLATSWACCIATGTPWLGTFKIHQTLKTLYVAAEGARGVAARIKSWEAANGVSRAGKLLLLPRPVHLNDPVQVADLTRYVIDNEIRFLVVDTYHRAAPGTDENSSTDFGPIFEAMATLRDDHGCSTLFVDHTGHAGERLRGTSGKGDDADYVLISTYEGVQRDASVQRKLGVLKLKDADIPDGWMISLQPVAGCEMPVVICGQAIDAPDPAIVAHHAWLEITLDNLPAQMWDWGLTKEGEAAQDVYRIMKHIGGGQPHTVASLRRMALAAGKRHAENTVRRAMARLLTAQLVRNPTKTTWVLA